MSRVVSVVSLGLCVALGAVTPAAAQPEVREPEVSEAEAEYARGVEARRERRDAEAVDAFRAAYELAREPRALAQLGLAEQAVGRWVDAYTHLTAALAQDDAWIEDHREVLETAHASVGEHVGQLEVEGNVEGAEIFLDGESVGRVPLDGPVPAPLGVVVVEARAPGHVPVQRSATISAGRLTRVSVRLVPELDHTAPAPPTEPPIPSEPSPPESPPPAPPSGTSPLLVGAIVSGAAALLLGAGTIVALAIREEHVLLYNDDERCDPFLDKRVACPDEYSTWRTAEDWAIGLGIGAGVTALAAATLLVLDLTDGDGGAQVSLRGTSVALSVPLP